MRPHGRLRDWAAGCVEGIDSMYTVLGSGRQDEAAVGEGGRGSGLAATSPRDWGGRSGLQQCRCGSACCVYD
jgi:hypothetical protein